MNYITAALVAIVIACLYRIWRLESLLTDEALLRADAMCVANAEAGRADGWRRSYMVEKAATARLQSSLYEAEKLASVALAAGLEECELLRSSQYYAVTDDDGSARRDGYRRGWKNAVALVIEHLSHDRRATKRTRRAIANMDAS